MVKTPSCKRGAGGGVGKGEIAPRLVPYEGDIGVVGSTWLSAGFLPGGGSRGV